MAILRDGKTFEFLSLGFTDFMVKGVSEEIN